jgi:hypothetical protein
MALRNPLFHLGRNTPGGTFCLPGKQNDGGSAPLPARQSRRA